MSGVRVRFAPSPTGYLHIGGARTAVYNYLYSKATGGTFVLRIEDTDQERSLREYEDKLLSDLEWLGITYDEGPSRPGEFGPYRQSERLEIYKEYAQKLVDENKAYYCFCTDEELEEKRNLAKEQKAAPVYDGTCRSLGKDEVAKKLAAKIPATIRFKAYEKDYTIHDTVRGEVTYPKGMVGDFVIMRSNGFPVFNYCCALDDILMKITNVIRGEDHLGNTLRQLMIYDAFNVKPPTFSHLSLLVGEDRQKLSKRHGSTSVANYRDDHYYAPALINYLILLGWSHPEEKDIFSLEEASRGFNINRFSKSPALFDFEKCKWMNGEYLKKLDVEKLVGMIDLTIPKDHLYHEQSMRWKQEVATLYVEKINKVDEILPYLDLLFSSNTEFDGPAKEVLAWETTPKIKKFLKGEIEALTIKGEKFVKAEEFEGWGNFIKKELGIKGKNLFMGMRVLLTGSVEGSELKSVIPLTPLEILYKRVYQE